MLVVPLMPRYVKARLETCSLILPSWTPSTALVETLRLPGACSFDRQSTAHPLLQRDIAFGSTVDPPKPIVHHIRLRTSEGNFTLNYTARFPNTVHTKAKDRVQRGQDTAYEFGIRYVFSDPLIHECFFLMSCLEDIFYDGSGFNWSAKIKSLIDKKPLIRKTQSKPF